MTRHEFLSSINTWLLPVFDEDSVSLQEIGFQFKGSDGEALESLMQKP